MAERTVWRICSDNGWWSSFGKRRRGKKTRVGAPAHDDLVRREFTAPGPNRVWLSDLTEHPTSEGKLYLCAVKDVWSNRIVGYSIAGRMESSIAVAALNSAGPTSDDGSARRRLRPAHRPRQSRWTQLVVATP
jgi:transposase InsO family protein